MQTPPITSHRWAGPESPLGRAAAAIRRLLADEAGEEDILAAEFHYQRAWDAYRWGDSHLAPDPIWRAVRKHDWLGEDPR